MLKTNNLGNFVVIDAYYYLVLISTPLLLKMNNPANELKQISDELLSFLHEKLGDTKIEFDSPPKKLEGGNETTIFHFKLRGSDPSLLKPGSIYHG